MPQHMQGTSVALASPVLSLDTSRAAQVAFGALSAPEREEVLRLLTRSMPLAADVDLRLLAEGMRYADGVALPRCPATGLLAGFQSRVWLRRARGRHMTSSLTVQAGRQCMVMGRRPATCHRRIRNGAVL